MGKCVHVIPGRARFTVPAVRRSETVARALLRGLRAIDGVELVEVRRASASVVVHYDPRRVAFETLCAWIAGQPEAAPVSSASASAPAPAPPALPRRAAAPAARARAATGTNTDTGTGTAAPALTGVARHLGTVISQTAFKVMLERVVHTGVSSLLRTAATRI